jgi:hypothetical protein
VLATGHPTGGIGEALTRPLTCVLVLVTAALYAAAAIAFARRSPFAEPGASSMLASSLVFLTVARGCTTSRSTPLRDSGGSRRPRSHLELLPDGGRQQHRHAQQAQAIAW